MIALVLVHQGLDVSVDLELGPPGAPGGPGPDGAAADGGVRQRGGDRLVVTAPADRAALEWALGLADRVTVLTVGPPESAGTLAWALGRGATRAVRVWDAELGALDLAATARVVAAAVRRIAPDLVVGGERGVAGATGALPALVAARLGWPLVDGADRLGREGDEVVAERRLRGGRREEVAVRCPAVATVTAGSAEPRYVSVRARREAAARGHEVWAPADLGLTAEAVRSAVRLHLGRVDWPRPRPRRTAVGATVGAAPRSAAERLRQLVGGGEGRPGPAATADPRLVEGEPRAVAQRILAFLEQNGFA
jgi:electron transfer flavoprotein beta subunit